MIETSTNGTVPPLARTKVCLIIRGLTKRSGGAERIFCEFAGMLESRGYEVTCLYYDHKRGRPFYPIAPGVKVINLYPEVASRLDRLLARLAKVPVIGRIFGNRIRWELANRGFVEQLKVAFTAGKPDVAIAFLPPANTPALIAGHATGTKVIPTNHNVPAEDYLSTERWDQNPIDRALRLSSLRHAAAIHVLFPGFATWFPADLQPRITPVPNYVSRALLKAKPAKERRKVILAVGRLAPVKNYETLLEAWRLIAADHPDWKVEVFGEGPQGKDLRKRVGDLGLEKSFVFAGHKAAIGEEYAKASIFCHPAHFEGFGLSVAEALAFQVPVVAFADCPGVNEFVFDDANGLMVDRGGGARALADALTRLIGDETLRRRLGEAGPGSIAYFNEDRFVDDWCRLIDKVVGDRRA